MSNSIPYKILEKRQNFKVKLYAILLILLLGGLGTYFYFQWQEFAFAQDRVAKGEDLQALLSEEALAEKESYEQVEGEFSGLYEEIDEKMAVIFPVEDDYTELTRQIDEIEMSLAKKSEAFEISNISFQNVKEEADYSVLPLRMNIRSSRENFTKFLHLIEESGSMETGTRLMDITSIRLNFENAKESAEEGVEDLVSFSVQINAYFQK